MIIPVNALVYSMRTDTYYVMGVEEEESWLAFKGRVAWMEPYAEIPGDIVPVRLTQHGSKALCVTVEGGPPSCTCREGRS